MFRSVVVTFAAVILLTSGTPAAAQPNTCIAGKLACTHAFSSAVFKCYAKIFKAGGKAEAFVAIVVVGLEP